MKHSLFSTNNLAIFGVMWRGSEAMMGIQSTSCVEQVVVRLSYSQSAHCEKEAIHFICTYHNRDY